MKENGQFWKVPQGYFAPAPAGGAQELSSHLHSDSLVGSWSAAQDSVRARVCARVCVRGRGVFS